MARPTLVISTLALVCLSTPALAGDLELVVFERQLGAGQRPTSVVSFPDHDRDYSQVLLTLESFNPCEDGVEGDEWDRTAYIYVQDDEDELIQIARWLTPYWNLPHVWTVDITEMQSLLHGDRKIYVDVGGGHQYSLSIDLTYGVPARLPVRATTMWRGHPGVADVDEFLAPLEFPVHERVDYVDVRINFSSHGGDGPIEFGPAQHAQIGVNGEISEDWYHYFSRGDEDLSDGFNCPDNPTGPQGTCADSQPACAVDDTQAGGACVTGNWSGPRINWCPGELIPSWIVDVSSAITAGERATVDVAYANVAVAGAGSLRVDSQWIESQDPSAMMIVSPLRDWRLRGFAAETLAGTQRSYWLKNHADESIEWRASSSIDWVRLDQTEGVLDPGEAVEVLVRLSEEADALPSWAHQATLSFYDVTHDLADLRYVELTPEAKGVLAYWPIEAASEPDTEGGALILDRSGREHHGALLDAAGDGRGEGRFGAGLALATGLERVEVPGAIVEDHRQTSYALWFKTDSPTTQILLSGGPEQDSGALRLFVAGEGSELRFHAESHTASWSELELADGQWHHVVVTVDGDQDAITAYLDGVVLETKTLVWVGRLDMSEGGRAAMGVQLDVETTVVESSTLDGSLDDLRIYNYVLDAAEVGQIYLGGPAMVPDPYDDERDVELERDLLWVPGASAQSHRLYFGRELEAVRDADESSELYMGELDSASFDPGALEPAASYYWRVDELTPDGVIAGPVWRFQSSAEGEAEGGGEAAEAGKGGCGCASTAVGGSALPLFVLVPLLARRRRRARSES